jgi:hypothetical protein
VRGVKDTHARLLVTPFVGSWIGRARPGDRFDPDAGRRAAAWAHWGVSNLVEMTGAADRTYAAMLLDGKFHDPKGSGPLVKPHMEIPQRLLERTDDEFPERLAQAGNALAFPWWVPMEVTAAKRAVVSGAYGSVRDFADLVNQRRQPLVEIVAELGRQAVPSWGTVEEALVADPSALAAAIAGDFTPAEVAEFFPAARELDLSITFDAKLRDTARDRVASRIGVWQVSGTSRDGERFTLGVVTPRMTVSSQFNDPLFAVERESPAALLVRGMLLRRLIERHLGGRAGTVRDQHVHVPVPGAHLRAIVAQVDQKLPEASVEAAVQFVRTYPDPDAAWQVLWEWSERTRTTLTVREEGFREAHRRIMRYVRRAEEPLREDINVLCPLGWDDRQRVVRVTFSRPRG